MEDMQEEQAFSTKKKIIVVSGVIGLAFLTSLVLVFFSRRSDSTKLLQPNPTVVPGEGVRININNSPDNPLIPQEEINKSTQSKSQTPTNNSQDNSQGKTYDFKYELAPNLQHQKRSLLHVAQAFAAEPCSLDTIPSSMPIFKLQQHLTAEDGQKIAGKFSLPITTYSLPTEGGVMQYFFTDTSTGDYLTIMEPSGVYTYHHAPASLGSSIDSSGAQNVVSSVLKEFFDGQSLEQISSYENPGNTAASFVYKYQQSLAGTQIMDGSSVGSLETSSPCNMKPAESVGTVEMWLAQDGSPVNLFSKIRPITESKPMTILDLPEALKQSEDISYIDPIVFSKKGTTSGKVVLDEAASPVYVDPGPQFGLSCYIPVYQACGKTEGGEKVCPIFPAVNIKDLKEYCAAKPLSGLEVGKVPSEAGDTIKYSHFPFNPPTPPEPPKIGQCGGGLVDYNITCSQKFFSDKSLPPACSAMVSVPTNESPDTYVCDSGCKEKAISGSVSLGSGGGDPCKQLFEDYNEKQTSSTNKIPLDKYMQDFHVPEGEYDCSVNICPC